MLSSTEKYWNSATMTMCSNQQSVKMELSNQEILLDKITSFQNSHLLTESIIEEHSKTKEVIEENQNVLQYLLQIASLENVFADANEIIIERAIKMSQSLNNVDKVLHEKKPMSDQVSNCWTWLNKIAIMNQFHLQNAADYHYFYHDASELNALMSKRINDIENHISSLDSQEYKIDVARKMTTLLSETLSYFLFLSNRIENLIQRSYNIAPIYLRCQQKNAEQPPKNVKIIFRYETTEFVVNDGSDALLIDNSDRDMWWIRLPDGKNVLIPSLCVWLPSPDEEIMKVALTLWYKFFDLWSQVLHVSSVWISQLFISYLSQINKNNNVVYTSQNCRWNVENLLSQMEELVATLVNINDQELGTRLATLLQQTSSKIVSDLVNEGTTAESTIKAVDIVQLDNLLSGFLIYWGEYKTQHRKTMARKDKVLQNEQLNLANAFQKLQRFNDNNRSDLEKVESILEQWRKPNTKFIRCDSRICLAGSLHSLSSPLSTPGTPQVQFFEQNQPQVPQDDALSKNTISKVIEQSCCIKCDFKDVGCQYEMVSQTKNEINDCTSQTDDLSGKSLDKEEAVEKEKRGIKETLYIEFAYQTNLPVLKYESADEIAQKNMKQKVVKRTMKIQKGVSTFNVQDCSTQCIFPNSLCNCMTSPKKEHKDSICSNTNTEPPSIRRATKIQTSFSTFEVKNAQCQNDWTPNLLLHNFETQYQHRPLCSDKWCDPNYESCSKQSQFNFVFPIKENSAQVECLKADFSSETMKSEIVDIKVRNKDAISQHQWKAEVYSNGFHEEKLFSLMHQKSNCVSTQTVTPFFKHFQTQFKQPTLVNDTSVDNQSENKDFESQYDVPTISIGAQQSTFLSSNEEIQTNLLKYLQVTSHAIISTIDNIGQQNSCMNTKEVSACIENSIAQKSTQKSQDCSEIRFHYSPSQKDEIYQFRLKADIKDNSASIEKHRGNHYDIAFQTQPTTNSSIQNNLIALDAGCEKSHDCQDVIWQNKFVSSIKNNCAQVAHAVKECTTQINPQYFESVLDQQITVDSRCKTGIPTKVNSTFVACLFTESEIQINQPEMSQCITQYKHMCAKNEIGMTNEEYSCLDSSIQIKAEICEQICATLIGKEEKMCITSLNKNNEDLKMANHFSIQKIAQLLQTDIERNSCRSKTARRTMKIQKGCSAFDVKDCSAQCLFPNYPCYCNALDGNFHKLISCDPTKSIVDSTNHTLKFRTSEKKLNVDTSNGLRNFVVKDCPSQFLDIKYRCKCTSCL